MYQFDRRQLLIATGGLSALVATSGCGTTQEPTTSTDSRAVSLPTYVPFDDVKADLPGNADGCPPGYFTYPTSPVDTGGPKPAEGLDEVSVLVTSFGSLPPRVERNRYWQELNNRLGAPLKLNTAPDTDYLNKLNTALAGNDLPDIVMMGAAVPQMGAVLSRLFMPLTEFLAGDNIKDYPFLANIPTGSWRPTVFGGELFALPIPRAAAGRLVYSRDDLIAERGLNGTPANFEEFRELCRGLTDPKANRWAGSNPNTMLTFLEEMVGAPNMWREENGKFTAAIETEESKRALGLMAGLVAEGLFHPDTFSAGQQEYRSWLAAGRVALHPDGYAAWDLFVKEVHAEIGAIIAPAYDGGAARHFTGRTSYAITAVKKAPKAHVESLLRVANWLAAPFGTAEYLFRKYGLPDMHHTVKNGIPQLTDTGSAEIKLPLQYIVDSPSVLGPRDQSSVKKEHDLHLKISSQLLDNPTVGLYSDTALSKSGLLSKAITDAQNSILRGQKPLSSWDDTVAQWRRNGGDQIRTEYEKAFETTR